MVDKKIWFDILATLYFYRVMQKAIHPTYYPEARVTCACGSVFTTGSTLPEIRIELCSLCHPFYTGKQKFVDTARRVEKFEERNKKVADASAVRKGKKAKKVALVAKKTAKKAAEQTAPAL